MTPTRIPTRAHARQRSKQERDAAFERHYRRGMEALEQAEASLEAMRRARAELWRLTGGREGYPYGTV